ncbi:hypothetical protein Hte_005615 [Hypoxylon texense]
MRENRTYIHDNLRCLRDSAAAGCSTCQLFWTSIQEANLGVLINAVLNGKAPTNPGTPAASLYDGRFFTADRDTDGHITFARKQLADCQENHTECRIDRPPEMPTRVLDVGFSRGSTKLVETFRHDLREPYLALSYCWGRSTGHAMKLEYKNYFALLQFINEEALTVAHRECIAIARQLRIRYVWIDALCIIQGSYDDWEYESTRIAQTYGNAILTILAGRAADAGAGFAVNRPEQESPFCAISFARGAGDVFLSPARKRTEGPTSMRAWCFQEKVLSRRTLLYAEEQVCFSCQRVETWEDGSKNMLDLSKLRLNSFPSSPKDIDQAEQDRLRAQMLTLWYKEILPDYTDRSLTYPTDVFAAIGSIAQLAQNSIRSRYLAGIWEADLPRGLLWKATFGWRSERPTDKDGIPVIRAPSWSWASIQGQVDLRRLYERRTDHNIYPPPIHSDILIRPLHCHPLPTPQSPPLPRWTPLTSPPAPGHANVLRMPRCELVFLARPKRIDLTKLPKDKPVSLSWLKILTDREFLVQPTTTQNATLRGHDLSLPQIIARAVLDVAEDRYEIQEDGFEGWLLPVLKDKTGSLLLRRNPSDKKFRRLGRIAIFKATKAVRPPVLVNLILHVQSRTDLILPSSKTSQKK